LLGGGEAEGKKEETTEEVDLFGEETEDEARGKFIYFILNAALFHSFIYLLFYLFIYSFSLPYSTNKQTINKRTNRKGNNENCCRTHCKEKSFRKRSYFEVVGYY
jgi:hypothetical protein